MHNSPWRILLSAQAQSHWTPSEQNSLAAHHCRCSHCGLLQGRPVFTGREITARQLTTRALPTAAGKRVVVVGSAKTALDVAGAAAEVAESVTMLARKVCSALFCRGSEQVLSKVLHDVGPIASSVEAVDGRNILLQSISFCAEHPEALIESIRLMAESL